MMRWMALGLLAVAAILAGVALGPAEVGVANSIGGLFGCPTPTANRGRR